MIPTPSIDPGIARADVTSNLLLRTVNEGFMQSCDAKLRGLPSSIGAEELARLTAPRLRVSTRGVGGEALQGGGDDRQVEFAQVVHHVPPHARQVSGPGATEPAKASIGENGVQATAIARGSLSRHQTLGLQAAHDP